MLLWTNGGFAHSVSLGYSGSSNHISCDPMPRKSQKVAFVIAIICYVAAAGCIAGVFYFGSTLGSEDPIVASLAATVVFCLGAGIVLHVIGRANLPDLRIGND